MSSSNYYTSSSSPSSVVSTSTKNAPQSENQMTIVGIILGVVGVILFAGVIYATLRLKRRRSPTAGSDSESFVSSSTGARLDQYHPAARITPFGTPGGETPRFKHTPGSGMRVAIRRPDGAWEFEDPRRAYTPSSRSDLEFLPSPSSSLGTLPPKVRSKEHEFKSSRDLRYDYDRDYDIDIDISPPPPAYGYDSGGYYMPPSGKN